MNVDYATNVKATMGFFLLFMALAQPSVLEAPQPSRHLSASRYASNAGVTILLYCFALLAQYSTAQLHIGIVLT
jgi:hypothetical protein